MNLLVNLYPRYDGIIMEDFIPDLHGPYPVGIEGLARTPDRSMPPIFFPVELTKKIDENWFFSRCW